MDLRCWYPESLSKDSREEAAAEHRREKLGDVKGKGRAMDVGPEETGDEHGSSAGSEQVATAVKGRPGIIRRFLSPLAVFLPVDITDASGVRKKKDWSLTYLALTLFLYHLSTVGDIFLPCIPIFNRRLIFRVYIN